MFAVIFSAVRFSVTSRMVAASFILFGSSFASSSAFASELTTTETQVRYAKDAVKSALGSDYSLVPGSMSVTDEEAPVASMEGFVRGLVGKEKEIYTLRFRVVDVSGAQYSGSAKLNVTVCETLESVPSEDNNTTRRTNDLGTGRMIKVQMQTYLPPSSAITARELLLRPIK